MACLKRPLKKKTKIGFQDRLWLNAGQKYCWREHSAILSTCIKALSYHLSLRLVLPIFEWPLKTGYTVVSVLVIIIMFMNLRLGFLADSVDLDWPASEEASWSGSTLFVMQLMLSLMVLLM